MPSKEELSWLAGIIDGEGHIFVRKQYEGGGHLYRVGITNSDIGIISEVKKILDSMHIRYSQSVSDPNKYKKYVPTRESKLVYRIEVCREEDCKYLTRVVSPYIRCSYKQKKIYDIQQSFYERSDKKKSNRKKFIIPDEYQLPLFKELIQ